MERQFSELEKRLIDGFQHDFPLHPRPYRVIAQRLGVEEETVIELLAELQAAGVISRIGAVLEPHRAGYSTLAAMQVPAPLLPQIAAFVSAYPEVTHNYEREHRLNLWFVIAAPSRGRVAAILSDIEYRTGLAVLDLPLLEAFHLDLGFPVQWN